MDYRESCCRILELSAHKNPVDTLREFYEWLGRPGSGGEIIHVAGTNGKGSVCAFLDSVLSGAGYRVGVFTSPHLVTLRERFRLCGKRIDEGTFARLYARLQEKLRRFDGTSRRNGAGPLQLTFFETLLFLFLLWMEEEKPDFVVLEAGIGGKNDATAIVEKPAVAVITGIGLDHCSYLGNTLEEIAVQKAGIMKPGTPAVCWDTSPEVTRVFAKRARELSSTFVSVSKNEVAFSKIRQNNVDFFLESAYYNDIEACLASPALYQAENAALAVRALEQIVFRPPLTKAQVEAGLSAMRIRARMEEILPGVFVDGANNPDGIRAFLQSVAAREAKGKRMLLFSASADKDTRKMAELIRDSGLFDREAVTAIDSVRSMDMQELQGILEILESGKEKGHPPFAHSFQALDWLRKLAKGTEAEIYIVGSLYLAGEIVRLAEEKREVNGGYHD